MAKEFKTRIKLKHDTTENWNAAVGFIPMSGEVIVYDDYETIVSIKNGITTTKNVPGIKIGTGNAYIQDLPFVGEEMRSIILRHIEDDLIHVTLGEKAFWNNKVNIDDSEDVISGELDGETLVFNRL